jgi:aerobic-type carbon monoxide dehydrogenase small subunit (CoxS/CutS family)
MFACAECGARVTYVNGEYVRSCEHTGAILASMRAIATGTGGVSIPTRLKLFIRDLKRAISKYTSVQ